MVCDKECVYSPNGLLLNSLQLNRGSIQHYKFLDLFGVFVRSSRVTGASGLNWNGGRIKLIQESSGGFLRITEERVPALPCDAGSVRPMALREIYPNVKIHRPQAGHEI